LVRNRARLSAIGAGAVLAALMVTAVWAPLGGAQTATPFPRSIVAFVPATVAGSTEPALAVQWAAAGDPAGVGSDRTRPVTVTFAAAFALPAGAYRVSVVVGDPTGARTRASFTSSAGVEAGTVETSSDGTRWTAAGATRATFSSDSVLIDVPVAGATTSTTTTTGSSAAARAIWFEAQIDGDPARLSRSPAYSLDAFLGRVTEGRQPATAWAEPAVPPGGLRPADAAVVAIPGAPPTVSVDNRALVVDETERVPAEIAGQAVVGAGDDVTFMPGFTPSGATPVAVHIDRTTGAIAILAGQSGLPSDLSGDRSWLLTGLPATDPGAPTKVVIDLEGVASAMGLHISDAEALGLGLRRTFTLADGSTVVGASVLGTLDWFQQAAVPKDAAASSLVPAPASSSSSSVDRSRIALIGAGVVVVLAMIVLVLVRRRRQRRRDRDPFRGITATPVAEPEPGLRAEVEAEPVRRPEPAREPESEPLEHEADDLERGSAPGRGTRSPEDALAALDAQVDELIARVDELGSEPRGPAPDGDR
jgi:hypothetical protein